MKNLIVASNNENKIKEIKEILKDLPLEIYSLKEKEIFIDVEEDGETFEENAFKKAREIYEVLKEKNEKDFIVMADDSGLEVDALNKRPGVYSARYAGEHGDSKKNNEKLLEELKGVPFENRGGEFVCHLALIDYYGKESSIEGRVKGKIIESIKGEDGFGYDPLFLIEALNKTFGEIKPEEKNIISHRGIALKELKKQIVKYL